MDRLRVKNNHGSTILIVIIATAFIGILATVVLSMSLTNIEMKSVDRNSKENFYAAETVVDEITAGLEADVADILYDVYTRVMLVYGELPISERNLKFKQEFKADFLKKYDDSVINDVYADTLTLGTYQPSMLQDFLVKTKDRAKVESVGDAILEWVCDYTNLSKQYICFKNVRISYEDTNSYLTRIETDIKVKIPNINLESIGNRPPFTEYAIIANRKLDMAYNVGKIYGNLYAGDYGLYVGAGGTLSLYGEKVVTPNAIVTEDNGKLLMTDMDGVDSRYSLDIWANNIETIKSSSATSSDGQMNLAGNFYISDDVTLNAPGGKVTIAGNYFGYGHGDTPATSSAMIVNRMNCILDLSRIENMFLGGRAYVEPEMLSVTTEGDLEVSNSYVMTGEAISTKGNQFAYLLPGACIGVKEGNGIGYNPLTLADYQTILSDSLVTEVDYNYILPFSNKPLSAYVDTTTATSGFYRIFDQTNTTTLVYYYPKFKSPESANAYFKDYVANASYKEAILTRLQEYGSKVIPPSNFNSSTGRKTYSGNVLFYNSDLEVYHNSVDSVLPQQFKKEASDLAAMYQAFCKKLLPSLAQYAGEDLNAYATLFDSLINESSSEGDGLKDLLGGNRSKEFKDDTYGTFLLVNNEVSKTGDQQGRLDTDSAFKVDGSVSEEVRLIIATGDVVVERSFNGLIISKGVVTIKNDAIVTAMPQEVFDLICHTPVRTVFRDYRGFGIYLTDEKNDTLDIGSLITTENWKKN